MQTNENLQFEDQDSKTKSFYGLKVEKILLAILLALAVLIWLPRLQGPIDLRWDGGVYYILGTSLAEGKGYKLLNEPGEIDAVQYPPLLPLIIAGHQLVLGTSDPTTVGWWLRISSFIIFVIYICLIFEFFKKHFSLTIAFFATAMCLFSHHIFWLSDLCFPEILFGLLILLFILNLGKGDQPKYSIAAYSLAVAGYALRTMGLVGFVVWVVDSLLRKKFKQAAVRLVLVLIPIFCWQFYIHSVESSEGYNNPAYTYQRAPYMFYNVTYTRNIALHDPFKPKKGARKTVDVIIQDASVIPTRIGESVSTLQRYWERALKKVLKHAPRKLHISKTTIKKLSVVPLYALGFFVLFGLVLGLRRQPLISLYVLFYLALICLVPFPDQYVRYLTPIIPFLVLFLFTFLLAGRKFSNQYFGAKWSEAGKYFVIALLSVIGLMQLYCFLYVYSQEHQQIEYIDRNNKIVKYPLFYNDPEQKEFDLCITYVKENAKPDDVIAAGTPHWIYLRTGLKSVMIPFENDVLKAKQLLDSVPVSYLIIGDDPISSSRYMLPVVQKFPAEWKKVYSASEDGFAVYQRIREN